MAAATGVTSNLEDMAKFVSAQFRKGPRGGAQIVSTGSLREMHRVRSVEENWTSGTGLGFDITRIKDRTWVGHGGGYPGNTTQTLIQLDDKVGVASGLAYTSAGGEVLEIDAAAGGGGVKRPAGAIGVEGHGQPVGLDHRAQGGHDRLGRLGGPELRIEQALGRIVDDRDHVLALGRAEREPGMGAAIEVQQFTKAGPRLAPAAMAPAGAPFADQARLLQGKLNEAVRQPQRVVAAGVAFSLTIDALVLTTKGIFPASFAARLRDEVEATQDHAEKAEDVEQRAQRARSSSRTKNLTSPRVI